MSSKFPTMGEIMQVEDRLRMIIDAGSAIDLPPSVGAHLQELIRELRIPGSDLSSVRQTLAEAQNYIDEYPVTPLEVQRYRDTGETGEYRQKRMSRLLELEDYEIDVLEDEWRHIYKSDPVKRLLPPNKRSLYAKKDPLVMGAYKTSLIDSLVRTPRVGDPIFRFEGNKRLKQFIGAADTLYIPVDQAMLKVLLRRVDRSPKDIAYDTVQQMMNLAHGAPGDKVWGIPRDIAWEVGSKLEDDETNRLLRRAIERGASNLVEEDIPTGIFSHKAVEDLKGAIRQIRETPEARLYAKTGSGRGEVVDLATDKYFAIDPGNADLYAASTKEQMEARAKARSPKAVETINNMIDDVIKMGYSDVDAAVVINQNILDYLQHVERSIDPQARRLMSYSAMLPSELVNRMEELGPERVRRLAEGAKRLGLKIPKSLGAVGLMALIPFLEDEEAAAVGTAAVSGYGLPKLLSTDEKARLNRLRAELEAKAKIIGVDPRQAFVGSPDILEDMDFPIDEYRQLLEKEIRSKASGPMGGRNVQDYIALVTGEVPDDPPPIPGAGGPPQDDDPPRELTQQERESRAFAQQERERLIAEGIDPDNVPLERRGYGLMEGMLEEELETGKRFDPFTGEEVDLTVADVEQIDEQLPRGHRLKEKAAQLLNMLRGERGAVFIPTKLPKKKEFVQGIANVLYGGDVKKVQKKDVKHFGRIWKQFGEHDTETIREVVTQFSPADLTDPAEKQALMEARIVLAIRDEQGKKKTKGAAPATTAEDKELAKIRDELKTEKVRVEAAKRRAEADLKTADTPAKRRALEDTIVAAKKRIKELGENIKAALKDQRGAVEIPRWMGGMDDPLTDVQEMATGPQGRLQEEDVMELKEEFERPTKRQFDMADDPLTPSQAAREKEFESVVQRNVEAERRKQILEGKLEPRDERDEAMRKRAADRKARVLQAEADEAARATRSVKAKKLGSVEEYDMPRRFLNPDQQADIVREGIRQRNLGPTPQQRAVEAAIRDVQQGTGQWIAGGPDDPPLWWRNQMARAEEAARRRAQFRLVKGGEPPKGIRAQARAPGIGGALFGAGFALEAVDAVDRLRRGEDPVEVGKTLTTGGLYDLRNIYEQMKEAKLRGEDIDSDVMNSLLSLTTGYETRQDISERRIEDAEAAKRMAERSGYTVTDEYGSGAVKGVLKQLGIE